MSEDLLSALSRRIVIADGATGTMLQEHDLTLADFEGHEGCNEVLNVTRPEIVRSLHDAFFEVGVDAVETNTFGANLANLGEYGIEHRIRELARAGAQIAAEAARDWSSKDHPRYVLGSVGPGTKLPTLGHAPFAALRGAYGEQVAGMLEGGVDAVLIETSQDLLQAKAAVLASHDAMAQAGRRVPILVSVTVETTGTMLLGSEIGAALTALQPLGIDAIGLNCATGPAEMSEHLRHLSRHASVLLTCMPNAGLPELTPDGARYPLTPGELADAHETFVADYGLNLIGGCCGTTPEHLRQVVERLHGHGRVDRSPASPPSVSSLYHSVPLRQEATFLTVGERTNANGSKAFREAMLAQDWEECVQIARDQERDGAHVLDVCIDYVGRDGTADMADFTARLATATTLPVMLDSTEPEVVRAGLERLAGRAIVNSVNYEDGDGPGSRFRRVMPLVQEHGAAVVALTIDEQGQARTRDWKVSVGTRLIEDLTRNYGMAVSDILVDTLTFPIATGQEETRRDGIETIEAIRELKRRYPDVNTVLGVSNVSFGLNPAARQVLNSVFLHECVAAGLDSAIVHASKILPMNRISDEQREAALDLVYDRRRYDDDGALVHDPLTHFLEVFSDAKSVTADRADELAGLPLVERLQRRVIDGEAKGLTDDLDEALRDMPALGIVNDVLLPGMRTVGELFGAGEMQLPFVLQSAEVMKAAVAHLEPHMEKTDESGKGTIVLATVKGDVHDIGKNLVDIILSNNGYSVVNIGIKQPISAILQAAQEQRADAIGMSGLLVKSTVIMKENLEEMNSRGVDTPVLLGGAALTRAFVEQDLAEFFAGEVRYAKDAFEGLALMDAVMAVKRGDAGAALPERRTRRVRATPRPLAPEDPDAVSDVARDTPVPTPPFWGSRVVKGIALKDYVAYLDERALFRGQWGLSPGKTGPDYEELVETQGRPRLRSWLSRLASESLLEAAVVYGYWPARADGNAIVIGSPDDPGTAVARFEFPRQRRGRHLCLADYVRADVDDVIGLQIVTMGSRVSEVTADLFENNSYRDYLELHGLSVQLAEALAEYWHARVRSELGIGADDAPDITGILKQKYRGERFSFGYAACPDL
ncbi:MAG TPA: methionine synthase, partial [Actinomycetota bacterium]|nr:methionine synthase [Actinomycetota bacterium]